MKLPKPNRLYIAVLMLTALLATAVDPKSITVNGFNSDAIAKAIEQAEVGDTVNLPAAEYTITEAIRPKSKMRLVGVGQDKTIVRFDGDKPTMMVNLSNCEDAEVTALTLDGTNNKNVQQGIFAHNAQGLKIQNVTIRNLVKSKAFGPHGILFTGTNPTRKEGVTKSVIANCTIENIGIKSAWGAGIRLAWGSSENLVSQNSIKNTGRGGILANNGSTDLVIRGNRVNGSGGEGLGIEVHSSCDRAVIEDNQIDHWLSIGGSDFCAVRRNVISDKSGTYKFAGIEAIGSYLIITDNVIDDGQQIGLSVSANVRKDYVFWGYNSVRNCIQWGAQFQGEEKGIAYHYLYRCKFLETSVSRGKPAYRGDQGHGFRTNGNVRHITFEECKFLKNGRYGIQLGGDKVDFLSFARCIIKNNKGAAVVGPGAGSLSGYKGLEWIDCVVENNGSNNLPPAKSFSNSLPIAAFDAPAVAQVGEQVIFVSKSKADSIVMALWDFDDGPPVTGTQVSHTYQHSGTYRVTLVVWNEKGGARKEKYLRVVSPE